MVEKLKFKVLVEPKDVKPSHPDLKVIGVFNPAAARFGNEIRLLARVAETANEERKGYISSPYYDFTGVEPVLKIDWLPVEEKPGRDVRKTGGAHMRLAFISHLRLIRLDSTGFNVVHIDEKPTFFPQNQYEEYGAEDPRMTEIEGRFYFTYVAVSKDAGVVTAMASTADFVNYQRHGIIFCRENKDVVLLPEKVNGKYCAFHRPVGGQKTAPPNMMVAFSPDLIHWGEHRVLLNTRPGYWDADRMGAGAVPLKTDQGYLEIYHGVTVDDPNNPVGIYRAGAALFDLNDPSRCIARSPKPILSPEDPSETEGFVRNVIFPTGAVMDQDGEHVILFSGGADSVCTVMKISMKEVFEHMEPVESLAGRQSSVVG